MYNTNNNGPRTDPSVTPLKMSAQLDTTFP
jgi:hypothetical protein